MDPAQTTAPVPQHVNLYVEGLTEEELMLPVRERLPEWVKDANGNPVEATVTVAADAILKEEMRCSICLGTLTKTLTTACLHRFCSECLKEYLRMLGHEECPECRAKVPTHRSAKDDEKMDAIIDLLNAAAAAQPVSVDEEAAEVKKYKEACFHRKQQIIMKAKHKRQHTEQMQPTSGARPRTTKSQGSVAFTLTPLQVIILTGRWYSFSCA